MLCAAGVLNYLDHSNILQRSIGRDVFKEVIYQRLLGKPMQGVVKVIKVTKESHGFNGFLGLCVGNDLLAQIVLTTKPLALPQPEGSIMEYLQKLTKAGSTMTPQDILAVWEKTNSPEKPAAAVSVNGEDNTTVSTLTTPTPVSWNMLTSQITGHCHLISPSRFNRSSWRLLLPLHGQQKSKLRFSSRLSSPPRRHLQ